MLTAVAATLARAGLSADTIAERGYYIPRDRFDVPDGYPPLTSLQWCGLEEHGGYAYPHTRLGRPYAVITRPNVARIAENGREIKYEWPFGLPSAFDTLDCDTAWLRDTAVLVWIVEGAKKADALRQLARSLELQVLIINIHGTWNWLRRNADDVSVPLSDFDEVAWRGRDVTVWFDSDWLVKEGVSDALHSLCGVLRQKGARTFALRIPDGPDGSKWGIDDYLGAGGDPADVLVTMEEICSDVSPIPFDWRADAGMVAPRRVYARLHELAERVGDVLARPELEDRDKVTYIALVQEKLQGRIKDELSTPVAAPIHVAARRLGDDAPAGELPRRYKQIGDSVNFLHEAGLINAPTPPYSADGKRQVKTYTLAEGMPDLERIARAAAERKDKRRVVAERTADRKRITERASAPPPPVETDLDGLDSVDPAARATCSTCGRPWEDSSHGSTHNHTEKGGSYPPDPLNQTPRKNLPMVAGSAAPAPPIVLPIHAWYAAMRAGNTAQACVIETQCPSIDWADERHYFEQHGRHA